MSSEPSPQHADFKRLPVKSDETVMDDEIRQILKDHGRLPTSVETLPREADLYQAGMTSHASVNVMLAIEDRFDIEFPDRMLTRSVFSSIATIGAAVAELQGQVSV